MTSQWRSAVRRSSVRRRGNAKILIASVSIAAVIIAGIAWKLFPLSAGDANAGPLTHTVQSGYFLHEVVEQGEIESSENVEVVCEVKGRNGQTAILWVIEEGARVKEGDRLVTLDSSAFEQELVQQEIICNTSLALKIQAQNTFEASQIAMQEYLLGTYVNEEQKIMSELLVAEENLRRARQYAKYSEALAARGYVTELQLEGDRFAVDKAGNEVETAKTKLDVLEKYTKKKFIKQLESDIATAEAKWKSEESSYELELEKLKVAKHQVEKCDIRSPSEGQVVYANKVSNRGNAEFIVEAGAMVRERQEIIRLPDPANMQVKAKVNESQVTSIREGLNATIRIEAFGEEVFSGQITRVNEYPESTSFFSSQVKEYATFVQVNNPPAKLRPGLTAEVAIRVQELPDVLQIPVQAILGRGAANYCIQYQKGQWSFKELELGASNDKFVVVHSGLTAGENVVLNPRKYADQVSLPKIQEDASLQPVVGNGAPPRGQPRRSSGRSGGGKGKRGGSGKFADGDKQRQGGQRQGGQRQGGQRQGQPGGGGSPATAVSRIMGRFDVNKDGQLSKKELAADSTGRVAGMTATADRNGDGNITRAELTAVITARIQGGGGRGPGENGGGGRQRPAGAGA